MAATDNARWFGDGVRMVPRSISLEQLETQQNFALLAPGYSTHPHWTLVEELAPADAQGAQVVLARYEGAPAFFTGRVSEVQLALPPVTTGLHVELDDAKSASAIAAIRDAIAAGDVYQVNYTCRASVTCERSGVLLATLCRRAIPRFAAWFKADGHGEFVSASPEMLCEISARTLRVEPMKGTALPHLRAELLASEKDRAELAMITDLLRDDLNHLCEPHSVHVENEQRIIELPYVLQAVSDITGTLRPEVTLAQALAQLHPGGSITGAPRKAAMEHISKLEDSPRGYYCGCLGLLGNDLSRIALLIRTATRVSPQTWVYGVGSGITWDSRAEAEIAETRMKLGALT